MAFRDFTFPKVQQDLGVSLEKFGVMRRRLSGRRMLITGASSGIGRALAVEAGKAGLRLVLSGLEKELLDATVEELRGSGVEAVSVPGDVTSPEDRQAMIAAAAAHFGGLDILVNNAGVGAYGHFVDLPCSILRQVMEVNFFASVETCHLAIPLLVRGEQPLIVNVSSMFGRRGVPEWAGYCASKFALCGFSEALRAELARFEIELLLVLPGMTNTNLVRHLLACSGRRPIDLETGMRPEIVARRMLDGMRRNRRELRIGRDAHRLLWASWLVPRLVDWRQRRSVRGQYATEIASAREARRSRTDPLGLTQGRGRPERDESRESESTGVGPG